MLLPGADETGAQILADRLRSAIAGRPVPLNDTEIALTTSGGVAELRPCHSSIHSLIDSADAALMVAKQTGRNKIIAASRLNDDAFPDDYGALLGGLQARDIMVPILAQVRLHDTVQSTARRLMDLKLDSLPVVDDEGKPVGFVTEQDLMNSLLSSAGAEQRIADCGPLAAAIFDESASAEEIASFFSRSGMQRVVIVCQSLPIGVVSRRTLLRWLFNHGLKQRLSTSQRAETKRVQSSDLDRSITELQTRILRLVEIRETACGDELSSSVIGEATRIQESVESLLISCRDCKCDWQPADLLAAGASSLI